MAMLPLLILLGAVGGGAALGAPAENPPLRPGTVVRWPGAGLTACTKDGATWLPLAGACYYPIDLLAEGAVTVGRSMAGHSERRTLHVGTYPYPEQHIEIQDQSKVDLSPADLARAEREEKAVGKLFALATARRFTLPLAAPLENLPAGGRFGSRRWFNGEARNPHTGADFAAAAGTPVLALAEGKVVLAAEHFFSGNSVFLDHGDGLISMYFHLSRIDVKVGDVIHRGGRLGLVGATGRASGPHLHVGLRWHGARIDPEQLLLDPQSIPALR